VHLLCSVGAAALVKAQSWSATRGRLVVAALWKAQQVRGLPVTAVKHGTKAGLR